MEVSVGKHITHHITLSDYNAIDAFWTLINYVAGDPDDKIGGDPLFSRAQVEMATTMMAQKDARNV